MPRTARDTTAWVAEKIEAMDKVAGTRILSPHTFKVNRDDYPSFEVAVLSLASVTAEDIEPLLTDRPNVSMVVNVPKASQWRESALSLVREHGISFGGMSDLMAAIAGNLEDVAGYRKTENAFVERGLSQHSQVSRFVQEFDRVYKVYRSRFDPLRVVILNEYEITGEHVRTARTQYGVCDAVVITNPNGRATSSAIEIAQGMRTEVLMWREFLGRLNSE